MAAKTHVHSSLARERECRPHLVLLCQSGSSTPIQGRYPPLTARLCFLTFLPPPSQRPGHTPGGHRRLLALHPDSSALARPSCSTCDKFRCFHAATAVHPGRNRDAATRTAFHSNIPQQFFSSALIRHPLIIEELMKDHQRLRAAWRTHFDLPHRSRQAAISPSLRAKSRRETHFRKNSHI